NELPTLGEVLYKLKHPSHIVAAYNQNYSVWLESQQANHSPIYEIGGVYLDFVRPTVAVYSLAFTDSSKVTGTTLLDEWVESWRGFTPHNIYNYELKYSYP